MPNSSWNALAGSPTLLSRTAVHKSASVSDVDRRRMLADYEKRI